MKLLVIDEVMVEVDGVVEVCVVVMILWDYGYWFYCCGRGCIWE